MSKWQSSRELREFLNIFDAAVRVVNGDTYKYDPVTGNYQQTYPGRDWFKREHNRAHLHKAVYAAIELARPDDWHRLLLEWPHMSESDPNRIAYTPNERYGVDDRQLVTSIGKYLTRHFSALDDHDIRDLVARYTMTGSISITTDLTEMVNAVIDGPRSCMSHSFDIRGADDDCYHPYDVYHPKYGWGMAIRREGNAILGRCLVYSENEYKCFVRSYKRNRDESAHSGVDEAIEAYLKSLGYEKRRSWPDGARLGKIETRSGDYLMPYIDGDQDHVTDAGTHFVIDPDGNIDGGNTGGVARIYGATCSCCGERCDEDNGIWVGYHEEDYVGECCSDSYRYVYGRRERQYYIPESDAVYGTDGYYYDPDYIADNNIVRTVDDDYAPIDDCVYIDSEDEYYPAGDDRICYAEDTEEYDHVDNCWQCAATSKWYTDAVDSVEVDGETYHPDDAPEPAQEGLFDEENNNAAE